MIIKYRMKYITITQSKNFAQGNAFLHLVSLREHDMEPDTFSVKV